MKTRSNALQKRVILLDLTMSMTENSPGNIYANKRTIRNITAVVRGIQFCFLPALVVCLEVVEAAGMWVGEADLCCLVVAGVGAAVVLGPV